MTTSENVKEEKCTKIYLWKDQNKTADKSKIHHEEINQKIQSQAIQTKQHLPK